MTQRFLIPVATLAAMLLASGAAAKEEKQARPELFRKLVDCRQIAEASARLACYDAQVAALDAAETRQDVVVVDREGVKKAQRSLFGLTLPRIALFGNDKDDDGEKEDSSRIEAKIKSAFQSRDGRWTIIIDDGAKWVQTDERGLRSPAKPGQTVKIRRAAMGTFFANVDGQIAIRVRREN